MNNPCPSKTWLGYTDEGMCLPILDVLNDWERLEEHVYRCIPLLLELNYLTNQLADLDQGNGLVLSPSITFSYVLQFAVDISSM